jgi:hypothetical protein
MCDNIDCPINRSIIDDKNLGVYGFLSCQRRKAFSDVILAIVSNNNNPDSTFRGHAEQTTQYARDIDKSTADKGYVWIVCSGSDVDAMRAH